MNPGLRGIDLDRFFIGPVFGKRGPGLDPGGDPFHLRTGEAFPGLGGWHHVVRIVGGEARQQFALLRMTWHHRLVAPQIHHDAFESIQPQSPAVFGSAFALMFIRPVTAEAAVGQQGTDVLIERDGRWGRLPGCGRQHRRQGQ